MIGAAPVHRGADFMTDRITSRSTRSLRAAAAVACLVGLASHSAVAAPISYSESVSGDLSALPVSLGNLDVGANVISGFWSTTPTSPADLNTDVFHVDLPSGLQIDSIVLSYTLARGEATNNSIVLLSPFTPILAGPGTATGPFSTVGTYETFLSAGVIIAQKDWQVTYNVSRAPGDPGDPGDGNVPEPATLALLAVALLGAAGARRRS
jgi:hypothetical protein